MFACCLYFILFFFYCGGGRGLGVRIADLCKCLVFVSVFGERP